MNFKQIEAETFSGLNGLKQLNLKSNQINNKLENNVSPEKVQF